MHRECVSPDKARLLRAVPGHKDFVWTDSCLFHHMHLLPSKCLKRNYFGRREVFTLAFAYAAVVALQFTGQVVYLCVGILRAVHRADGLPLCRHPQCCVVFLSLLSVTASGALHMITESFYLWNLFPVHYSFFNRR